MNQRNDDRRGGGHRDPRDPQMGDRRGGGRDPRDSRGIGDMGEGDRGGYGSRDPYDDDFLAGRQRDHHPGASRDWGDWEMQRYGRGASSPTGDEPSSHGSSRYGQPPQRRHEEFEPDYHQWREEQMRSLDDDYRNFRQGRYKKFSDEFGQWRSSRTAAAPAKEGEVSSATSTPGKNK